MTCLFSTSYGEENVSLISFNRDNLKYLSTQDEAYLNQYTVGIDRGVVVPVQAGLVSYDFSPKISKSMSVILKDWSDKRQRRNKVQVVT